MLQQFADWLVQTVKTIWEWVRREVSSLINLPWDNLPTWKWYFAAAGMVVISLIVVWIIINMWDVIQRLFIALADLLYRLFLALPQVLAAGLIAYGILFIIRNF